MLVDKIIVPTKGYAVYIECPTCKKIVLMGKPYATYTLAVAAVEWARSLKKSLDNNGHTYIYTIASREEQC